MRILLVEDDAGLGEAVRDQITASGHTADWAQLIADAQACVQTVSYDLVLLDLRLPDISGFEVCRAIRRTSITPVIMVTAQTDTSDLVNGFDAGADDYVTKPVVPKELAARIRAALRRTQTVEPSLSSAKSLNKIGDVEIDRNLSIVKKAGVEISLTKTEYRLLVEFADHPGMVMSRDQLLERVWGYEYLGDSRLVDAHVRRLRVKVETQPEEPTMIVTVRGMGYRLLS